MSHFVVMVIGDNPEGQLDPFWELDLPQSEAKHDPRAVFVMKIADKNLRDEYEKFKRECPEDIVKYPDAKEWVKEYSGYTYNAELEGWGYWHNPNAKWDWFSIGGCWRGYFKLKEGKTGVLGESGSFGEDKNRDYSGFADQAKAGDIDWEGMITAKRLHLEELWAKWEKEEKKDPTTACSDYGIEKGETKEHYMDNAKYAGTPFALLKDGKWYERGSMGWWGAVSDEKDRDSWDREVKKLLEGLPEDTLLTAVDCHI